MANSKTTPTKSNFDKKLKKHLEKCPLTVADLAELTGVSRQMLYLILSGKSVPSWPVAVAIAHALELSTDEFL